MRRPERRSDVGRRFASLAIAVLALSAVSALADTYPARTITLVVPFAAGSGTDTVARVVAAELGSSLNARVVVENKAGANGAIAATFVARAEPDGHTLLMTTNTTHSANPSLMKSLPYDPIKDFTSITRVGNQIFMLVAHTSLPVRSVQDLIVYAKAHPGGLSYAYGNSTGIVAGETFKLAAGIDVLKVPYRSTPPVISDLVAGRVSYTFIDPAVALAQVRAGNLRALAVTTAERSRLLPDLPAMREEGVAGFDLFSWNAVFAPAGTPRPIVDGLNGELRRILDRLDVRDRLAVGGFEVVSSTPEELDAFVKSELVRWTDMIKAAHIDPE